MEEDEPRPKKTPTQTPLWHNSTAVTSNRQQKNDMPSEPKWIDHRNIDPAGIDENLRRWLFDQGSLTERLKLASANNFRVQLLDENSSIPLASESALLELAPDEPALIRQVLLVCRQQSWVYARSIIPQTTIEQADHKLANLGSKPLGAYLFSHPLIKRAAIEIAQICDEHSGLLPAQVKPLLQSARIWGRRSVFEIDTKPLLVNELFLPQIGRYPHR